MNIPLRIITMLALTASLAAPAAACVQQETPPPAPVDAFVLRTGDRVTGALKTLARSENPPGDVLSAEDADQLRQLNFGQPPSTYDNVMVPAAVSDPPRELLNG